MANKDKHTPPLKYHRQPTERAVTVAAGIITAVVLTGIASSIVALFKHFGVI